MKSGFVYMLRCFDGAFYVGVTHDADRRFAQHCEGVDPACYTFHRRPLRIAYIGAFPCMLDAITFEKQPKGWSHRKKRAFAEGQWSDLKRYARGPNRHQNPPPLVILSVAP